MNYQVIYIPDAEESLLQKKVEFEVLSEAVEFANKFEDSIIKHICKEFKNGRCIECNNWNEN